MSTHPVISNKVRKQYSQHLNNAKTAAANTPNKASKNGLPYTKGTGASLSTSLTPGSYSTPAASSYLRKNDKNRDGQLSRDEVTLSPEAYAKLDANSDGKVTKTELQNALRGKDAAIYQYYRSGGAQTHSRDVVTTLLSNAGGTGGVASISQAVSKYMGDHDKDRDGKLSLSETTLSAEQYAKLDLNADGKLAKNELEKALNGKKAAIDEYYASGGEKAHGKDMAQSVLFASNAGSTGSVTQAASRYIKDHDKNKDGRLSRSETTLSAEEYAKLDVNADGRLTRDELEKALNGKKEAIDKYYASGGEKTHDEDMAAAVLFTSNAGGITNFSGLAANRLLKDRDRNGDGVLSANELGLSNKAFAKIDKDKDRKITINELNTALAGKNSAIQTYYKNGGTDPLAKLAATLLKVV